MCTVSFIPTDKGFCLTSNRDEKATRKSAIFPKKYTINNKEIIFPKDKNAGGTWFANNDNAVIILLNGAEKKHISIGNYKKSRGIIVLELLVSDNVINKWKIMNMSNIEPFTIVFFNKKKLFQLQWNGTEKSTIPLDIKQPHIWSSATLYSPEQKEERKQWFHHFITNNRPISPKKIIDFHRFTENNNKNYGLVINRNNKVKTVSITQYVTQNNTNAITYIDLP